MLGRAMLALTLVLALTVPVALLLLWDRGDADQNTGQSLPISTYSDDKFRTVGNTPPTKEHSPSPTPSQSPTPSDTPSETPSDTPTPSDDPSSEPTSSDTVAPTRVPTRATTAPKPTRAPTSAPTSQPTTTAPPPPPADDGNMSPQERELFNLINDARAEHGCNAARPNSGLSGSAQTYADKQAKGGDNSPGDGTDATSASSSAQGAFNDMMNSYSGVLLDCGRTRLGIGYADDESCVFIICSTKYSWVADFGG